MTLRNSATHWGSVSKTFHWLIVLLLLGQGTVGLLLGDMPRGPDKLVLMNLHKSVGITILALAVLRVLWLLVAGRPHPAPGVSARNRMLAKLGHLVLYALLFAVPLTGWLLVDYGGRDLGWFGLLELPNLVSENHDLHEAFEAAHELLFWALTATALGHALAAAYHHVFLKDATLARMLPGSKRISPDGGPA
jgi:cytochrome b561